MLWSWSRWATFVEDPTRQPPPLFGFAYYDPYEKMRVYYLWPLNYLVPWCRKLWWRVAGMRVFHRDDSAIEQARREAYAIGWKKGFDAASLALTYKKDEADRALLAKIFGMVEHRRIDVEWQSSEEGKEVE